MTSDERFKSERPDVRVPGEVEIEITRRYDGQVMCTIWTGSVPAYKVTREHCFVVDECPERFVFCVYIRL